VRQAYAFKPPGQGGGGPCVGVQTDERHHSVFRALEILYPAPNLMTTRRHTGKGLAVAAYAIQIGV
jgi:hypothetical protein